MFSAVFSRSVYSGGFFLLFLYFFCSFLTFFCAKVCFFGNCLYIYISETRKYFKTQQKNLSIMAAKNFKNILMNRIANHDSHLLFLNHELKVT